MKAIIDTCVIIDGLQMREPGGKSAEDIFMAAAEKRFKSFIAAKLITDIH